MRRVVIVADGDFPTHPLAFEKLKEPGFIICCDRATAPLVEAGFNPGAIVGDFDSISQSLKERYSNILHHDPSQEYNDLTKAFNYALTKSPSSIIILGATGKREDHTLGNISLLADYTLKTDAKVEMWTNSGFFFPLKGSSIIPTYPGMRLSIFAFDHNTAIISRGLKYSLEGVVFDSWWKATLNEAEGDKVELMVESAKPILIFCTYPSII